MYNITTLLFLSSILLLIFIFIFNLLFGIKGTYTNHSSFIWHLLSSNNQVEENKNESKGEKECREYVESYFNKPFKKCRPDFLKNTISGHNLELDCFNEELKIAVEYNGEQHYKYIPHFHKNKEAFQNMKYRDEIKKRLCMEHNILLIVVPYDEKNIKKFLHEKLILHK